MRYFIIFCSAFLVLFFTACSANFGENVPKANVKAFDLEDQLILEAITYDKIRDYNSSATVYQELYEKSLKPEYAFERFRRLYELKQYHLAQNEIEGYLKGSPLNTGLLRYYVYVLNYQKKYAKAKEIAFKLLNLTKSEQDYSLLAGLYIQEGHFATAVKYLESAYNIAYDETILTNLTELMYYKLGKKKDAISYLETHSYMHGCTEKICGRLASLYADMDDTHGQISTYKRLYAETKDKKYAKFIIKAYAYNKETYKLVSFLEKSGFDDELLLRLYFNQKEFAKSIGLSNRLYMKTKKPIYQAQYAISLYEGSKKHSKKLLNKVFKNLKESLEVRPDAMYYNYLGYLLIDHDINVSQGIGYVSKALALESDSGFYMDSLAWGYYKEGKCSEALALIKKAKKILGKDNTEISKHYKKIQHCTKGK